jgi:hypothetical protein
LPGLHGGADLLDHLARLDNLLALHVAALLGRYLILYVNRRDPGCFVLPDGADHVYRVAVAVVGVGDERYLDRLGYAAGVVHHLAKSQKSDVWAAQERGSRAEARHIDCLEPRLLDEPGRESVVGAGGEDGLWSFQQLPQSPWAGISLH